MTVHVSATILRVTASLPDLPIHDFRDNWQWRRLVVCCRVFMLHVLHFITFNLHNKTMHYHVRQGVPKSARGKDVWWKPQTWNESRPFSILKIRKVPSSVLFRVLLILAIIVRTMVCGCMCGCMGVCLSMEGTTNTCLFLIWGNHSELRSVRNGSRNTTRPSNVTQAALPSAASAFEALSLLAEPRVADAVKVLGNDPFLPTQASQSWEMREMTWIHMDSPKGDCAIISHLRGSLNFFISIWKKGKHTNIVRDYSYTHRPPVGQVITTLGKAAQWMLAIAFFSEMVRRFCANMPLAQGFTRMLFNSSKWTWLFGCSKFKDFSVYDLKRGSRFWHTWILLKTILQTQCEASSGTWLLGRYSFCWFRKIGLRRLQKAGTGATWRSQFTTPLQLSGLVKRPEWQPWGGCQ